MNIKGNLSNAVYLTGSLTPASQEGRVVVPVVTNMNQTIVFSSGQMVALERIYAGRIYGNLIKLGGTE